MNVLDKNGDPILPGAKLTSGGRTGRFQRFLEGDSDDLANYPESGELQYDVDGEALKLPTFFAAGSHFCPDVEIVPEKFIEVLERYPTGKPWRATIRDSRSRIAVEVVRIPGGWEPLRGLTLEGRACELRACFSLGLDCVEALERAA